MGASAGSSDVASNGMAGSGFLVKARPYCSAACRSTKRRLQAAGCLHTRRQIIAIPPAWQSAFCREPAPAAGRDRDRAARAVRHIDERLADAPNQTRQPWGEGQLCVSRVPPVPSEATWKVPVPRVEFWKARVASVLPLLPAICKSPLATVRQGRSHRASRLLDMKSEPCSD
jgi:hypothetical protein